MASFGLSPPRQWYGLNLPHFGRTTWIAGTNRKPSIRDLRCEIEAKGWKVHDLYVEIGARGHVHRPYYSLCSVLGFTKAESRELKQVVEQVAKLCSHAIFVARYQRVWQERPLLDLFRKQ